MKHLKKFNEAIIDYKSDSIKSFYDECIEAIKQDEAKSKTSGLIYPTQMKEIGEKYGIEVVDYKTFYNELSDENKKTAPPQGTPAFALVNPDTNKIRVVLNIGPFDLKRVDKRLLDHIYHMLKHENIHISQKARSGGKGQGEGMDPNDRKAYFSNKDEIMAFSQSISDMVMDHKPKSLSDAISKLKSINLWGFIKSVVDKDVLDRYKKYIYLYLKQEFN